MRHTRKDISCIELKYLYLKKQFSLLKIGKLLGYSSRTIAIRAKECKISLRRPGLIPPKISDQALKHLYLQKRMSSRKIAKIYKCAYSYIDSRIKKLGIPRRTLADAHIVSKRLNFSGDLTEKAYLIGFRIGDLRSRKMYKNSETILVDCGSTKEEQIKLIKRLFGKYGRVWTSKPKFNGKIQIECSLNKSFSFLLRRYVKFPSWVAAEGNEAILSAIAGFSDAEGGFFIGRGGKYSLFSIGNYNLIILKQIRNWLISFGLKPRLFMGVRKGYKGRDGYSHKEDYWILSVHRKRDLLSFTKKILPYLRHRDKIKSAKRVIENINKRNQKYGFIGM